MLELEFSVVGGFGGGATPEDDGLLPEVDGLLPEGPAVAVETLLGCLMGSFVVCFLLFRRSLLGEISAVLLAIFKYFREDFHAR